MGRVARGTRYHRGRHPVIDTVAIQAFLAALGDPSGVWDFRAIHDVDKGRPGIPLRGTLEQVAPSLDLYNGQGYGIFLVINELDGHGRDAANVVSIRAHFTDSDGDTDWHVYHAMRGWSLPPTFTVVTSPGKHHEYWRVEPYADNTRFETIQRKLVTLWGSDPKVIDPPRVMRLPGTVHMKNPTAPTMVGMIAGSGVTYNVGALEWELSSVQASTGSGGVERKELGASAAPTFEWAIYALNKIDPGTLGRDEWLKLTAAYKTASFPFGEVEARTKWDEWCARYPGNDVAENDKLWRSIRDTKTGWSYLETYSGAKLERMFGNGSTVGVPDSNGSVQHAVNGDVSNSGVDPVGTPVPVATSGLNHRPVFLTPSEQAEYFAGCVLIENMGRILTPSGRFMDSTKFNAKYGGKVFVMDASNEKTTDEPWKAATRGQVFQIPKVDGIRFLPYKAPGEIIVDELGRRAVNTYKPAVVISEPGDVSPFLDHLGRLLPDMRDRAILLNFLRHCVQRPGVKAFWAPLIQSSEGAGKGIFKYVMTYALGSIYVHAPNAKELTEGGGKFNAWMRSKLLIIADEIKVDEKRDMVEVLKPMITEERIEIQGKGVDQETEDNVANWLMFTNYQDAIPISVNDRRYAIFYSAVQSLGDMQRLGMVGDYFPRLYDWLRDKGAAYVTYYLQHSPIDAEFDPKGAAHRAPITSSTQAAIIQSRGRVEQMVAEAVSEGRAGFRGGWISSAAVGKLLREEGLKVSPHAIGHALKNMGYTLIGRAGKNFFEEDMKQPNLYAIDARMMVADYAPAQGYASPSSSNINR
jgi:hypothetical protein